MFAQASLTFLMVGLLGTDISPPGSLRLCTLIRISGCCPSRAYTSMPLRNANSLTTWPPWHFYLERYVQQQICSKLSFYLQAIPLGQPEQHLCPILHFQMMVSGFSVVWKKGISLVSQKTGLIFCGCSCSMTHSLIALIVVLLFHIAC